jgi:heat shock protein HtpX
MVETFHTLIAKNKRNSFILMVLFMVFFVGLGLLIGAVWGSQTDRFGEYHINWHFSIMIAVLAGGISFLLTLLSYYGGDSLLMAVSDAHEIQKSDDPQLFNVVEELSIAAGQPMPKVYIMNTSAMNAFATGRDPKHASVAITAGLRQKLTRDELQGVMAHEMSHVRHFDIRYATLMAVMVGCIVMLSDIFLRSMLFGGGRRSSNRDSGGGAQAILMIVALILAILAPILAKIIQMALSRQREYLADAGAVELTRNPDGLCSALQKLSDDTTPLPGANRATAPMYIVNPMMAANGDEDDSSASIFDTHPPVAARIKRLRQLM